MNLAAGIVGLPNVGKSTLFNAVTAAGAECANYPFCTIEPNVGVVPVPDPRLAVINRSIETKEIIPAMLQVVDIAGLVAGASQGEGLGNRFLGHVREVHAILHVVRCFEDDDIAHVTGGVDPLGDAAVVETELALADLDTVQRAVTRSDKRAKGGDKEAVAELAAFEKAIAWLDQGNPARTGLGAGAWTAEDHERLRKVKLLTAKRVLYVCNVGEDDLSGESPAVAAVRDYAATHDSEAVVLCAQLEQELATMEPADRQAFLDDMGLAEPGLDRLVHAAFHLLGLMTFYTAGPKAIRAWTIRQGDTAPEAAGAIHTDFKKKFIRAETYSVDDLVELQSEAAIRSAGRMRSEGRDYVMQDGDVAYFLIGR